MLKSKSRLKEATLKDTWRSLELHIFLSVDNKMFTEVKAQGKLESVKRLCQRINEVMYYVMNVGLIEANPAVKNMPALKPEVPELLKALETANIERQTRCLLFWQLLTITRPTEAAEAKWSEIDLDNKLWTIPADRMKMNHVYIIPLCQQAIEILETMKLISEHIFPSMKSPYNKPMNSQTVNAVIKRIGFAGRLVAHGFRSIASTALNEKGFNSDVIEAALAHIDSNEVRRAYNRGLFILNNALR